MVSCNWSCALQSLSPSSRLPVHQLKEQCQKWATFWARNVYPDDNFSMLMYMLDSVWGVMFSCCCELKKIISKIDNKKNTFNFWLTSNLLLSEWNVIFGQRKVYTELGWEIKIWNKRANKQRWELKDRMLCTTRATSFANYPYVDWFWVNIYIP